MSTTTEQTKTANPATVNPGPPKPPPLPPILTLQHFLDLEIVAQKSNLEPSGMVYEGFTLKSKDFAISIILIDTTGDHYAGIKDTDMYYSGSLVKVAGLYAAHDLRAEARRHAATQSFGDLATFQGSLDGVVNPTGAIPRLRAMSVGLKPSLKDIFVGFKPSAPNKVEFHPTYQGHLDNILHNAGARGFIRPLGYSYINVSMMRSGFFDPDPAKLNGIWLAGDYSGDLPKAQRLAVERVERLDVRDQCKRMQVEFHAGRSRVGARPRGVHVADHAVGQQRRHDRFDVELAVQAQRQRRGGAGRPGEFDSGQRRKLWNGGHLEAPWIR